MERRCRSWDSQLGSFHLTFPCSARQPSSSLRGSGTQTPVTCTRSSRSGNGGMTFPLRLSSGKGQQPQDDGCPGGVQPNQTYCWSGGQNTAHFWVRHRIGGVSLCAETEGREPPSGPCPGGVWRPCHGCARVLAGAECRRHSPGGGVGCESPKLLLLRALLGALLSAQPCFWFANGETQGKSGAGTSWPPRTQVSVYVFSEAGRERREHQSCQEAEPLVAQWLSIVR